MLGTKYGANYQECIKEELPLREADSKWTFRFMDLSAELSNIIYRELLVLQNSRTCHLQILATSKQVNEEASSILYGDNWIQVAVTKHDVQVRGIICWRSDSLPTIDTRNYRDLFDVAWPDFLRRAQWLECVARTGGDATRLLGVLYLLCSFLQDGHRLRAIELDGTVEVLRNHRDGSVRPSFDARTTSQVLRPLQLLGCMKRITIRTPLDGHISSVKSVWPCADRLTGGKVLEAALFALTQAKLYLDAVQKRKPTAAARRGAISYAKAQEVENLAARLGRVKGEMSFEWRNLLTVCNEIWESGMVVQTREMTGIQAELGLHVDSIGVSTEPRTKQLLQHIRRERDARSAPQASDGVADADGASGGSCEGDAD